jgi:pimeloyl-ACP methyl ester carboxylesterase
MISECFTEFKGYRIWCRVAKSATSISNTPLLLLHGGPGMGSDYFEPLETMAEQGRTVIRFDQLGCGRSDRPRDLSLWMLESVVEQTESIRKALGLDRIHLLGHSWGGMVALKYLLKYPLHVQKACLCSPVVSVQLWGKEAHRLLSQMPSYISEALDQYERSYRPPELPEPQAKPSRSWSLREIDLTARMIGLIFPFLSSQPVARIASWILYMPPRVPGLRKGLRNVCLILSIQFFRKHVCRLRSMPFGILRMLAGSNMEILETLLGPSDFFCSGLLKDWDFRPSLSQIRCPTLILSGRYDVATPAQMAILRQEIANSRQIILDQSAHFGMWEQPEDFRAAILHFIQ